MFKINLDNQTAIKKLDKNQVAASLANLPKQLTNSYNQAKKTKLPASFTKIDKLVFCGMGGSNLASELTRRIFGSEIKIPLVLVRGYNLPNFASKNTLVIISSYSGNTEETLSCLSQALKIKAKIICLSSGGKLEVLAKKYKLPYCKINPEFNPSNQPRHDIGSQLGTVLALFGKLKLIKISDQEINDAAAQLVTLGFTLLPNSPQSKNPAKQLAQKLYQKNLYLIGAEHLSANAHILANQINESSKQLANPYKIPELNHHFLEGLSIPEKVIKNTACLFLMSNNYSQPISKRFIITKKVLNAKKINSFILTSPDKNRLTEALLMLAYSSWISFYLAMLNRVNPAETPIVDWFKKELVKQ